MNLRESVKLIGNFNTRDAAVWFTKQKFRNTGYPISYHVKQNSRTKLWVVIRKSGKYATKVGAVRSMNVE